MAKSIVQLVLTIRNPVAFVKNYVRIHIIFQYKRLSKLEFAVELHLQRGGRNTISFAI